MTAASGRGPSAPTPGAARGRGAAAGAPRVRFADGPGAARAARGALAAVVYGTLPAAVEGGAADEVPPLPALGRRLAELGA